MTILWRERPIVQTWRERTNANTTASRPRRAFQVQVRMLARPRSQYRWIGDVIKKVEKSCVRIAALLVPSPDKAEAELTRSIFLFEAGYYYLPQSVPVRAAPPLFERASGLTVPVHFAAPGTCRRSAARGSGLSVCCSARRQPASSCKPRNLHICR